jgi:hypothetical protein
VPFGLAFGEARGLTWTVPPFRTCVKDLKKVRDRHIEILEDKKIETLQVSKCREDLNRPLRIHVMEIEVYYQESGYRHSRGQEIGEVRSENPGKI